jgi:hypothetical protein
LDGQKRGEAIEIISKLVELLSDKEKQALLSKAEKRKGFPISIFRTILSGLEAITVYLKDVERKSINEIAKILNRKPSTLYTTYHNAKKKLKQPIDCSDTSITIPLDIFSDRKFSILESLVSFLKEKEQLPLAKIAGVLKKNYSTIKTVYKRYQEKQR